MQTFYFVDQFKHTHKIRVAQRLPKTEMHTVAELSDDYGHFHQFFVFRLENICSHDAMVYRS